MCFAENVAGKSACRIGTFRPDAENCRDSVGFCDPVSWRNGIIEVLRFSGLNRRRFWYDEHVDGVA